MLLKTKEALEKNGVDVVLYDQWKHKFQDFDILHIFGSVKDCLGLVEAAKRKKIKVVLSPIFWSTLQRSLYEYGSISKKSRMSLRHITKVIFPVLPSARRKILLLADKILPNSYSELLQVSRLFSISKKKMQVVPLGVDEKFVQAERNEFITKFGIKEFVLSVGRIEPRKNQLNLIKVMQGLGKQLVIIGDPVSGYESYFQQCKAVAAENGLFKTIFINRVEHSDSLLSSAYAACSVFILQGWFETPGLVALEAGLAGAKLVVTCGGSTRDYFLDYVEYFNPASTYSMRQAILRAIDKDKSEVLKEHIRSNFLWQKVADENIKVYKSLL